MAWPIFTAKKAAESSQREECESDEKRFQKTREGRHKRTGTQTEEFGTSGTVPQLQAPQEKIGVLLLGAVLWSAREAMALSKFSEDYDLFFRNAPLRDLKQVHAHFLPSGLKFIVTKQAVLLGLFNGPKLLTLARDDPSIVAKILAKHVALDLAYTSVRRALERTALALLEEELAARFFRGKSACLLFFVVYCATSALFQIPHALRPRH